MRADVGGGEVAQHQDRTHRRRVASGRIAHRQEPAMEIDTYEPGVPSWIDLGSPDPQGAADFYGALFGWDAPEGPPETGGYRVRHGRRSRRRRHRPGPEPRPAGVDDVHRGGERRRDRREGDRRRRSGDPGADGRARRRPHGGVHRFGRCVLLRLAAGDAPRRAAGQRAGHLVVERADHDRCRRVEGVLRRGVRLGCRHARAPGPWATTPNGRSTAGRWAG